VQLGTVLDEKKFHGVTYTIWMKKDVSEERAEECRLSNTLSLVIGDLNTSSTVQIWSLSQLLSVSVQMAQASSLVLSFLERSSIQSGLRLMMGLGMLITQFHWLQI
jgi:hypothetical protein